MAKRRRPGPKLTEMLPAEVIHSNPPALAEDRKNNSLADIRANATQHRNDTAHVIADLEAWRSEIDSTIAFLKANR
jgi:hypothetical protein